MDVRDEIAKGSRTMTAADYFTKAKDNQRQALKMLGHPASKKPKDVRDEIATAIINEEVVSFSYDKQDGDEPQRRVFSPWEPLEDGKLVIGWDHDKAGIRSFKVDQIAGIESYPAEHYALPAS